MRNFIQEFGGGVCLTLRPKDICSFGCLKERSDFNKKYNELKTGVIDEIILNEFKHIKNLNKPKQSMEEFTLQYAPVGNYTQEPLIIICGKTTSGGSHDLFKDYLKKGASLHEACFKSIYSNMKDNLFKYLEKIRLFDYLRANVLYWENGNYKYLWNQIFEDLESSLNSGIQLTQACNCAILNKDTSKRSSEPPIAVFEQAYKSKCFFKQFRISENLKLIIFLDTPYGSSRFHQEKYWNKSFTNIYPHVKYISITHPSRENSDVYNYLSDLSKMKSNKKANAIKLLNIATEAISQLMRD